jgi:hypothetical protein
LHRVKQSYLVALEHFPIIIGLSAILRSPLKALEMKVF